MALEVGSVLGALEIVCELARGGFGVVYRAVDRQSGNEVAVKILHADLVTDAESTRRFEREIRAIQLIRHPNIVKILDVGSLPTGEPFFAMELLSGATLAERIESSGRLSLEETLDILTPLCSALEASHAKGIIHRDLKASNIFLSDRVVLLDFGIAKLVEDTGTRITSSKHIVGTPTMMAPEQIVSGEVTVQTDVYALGALTYLMLTAALPFRHRNLVVLQELQLYQAAAPPSDNAPVSLAVDEVVLRALSKEKEARQAGPGEFLAELRATQVSEMQDTGDDQIVAAVFLDVRADIDVETVDDAVLAAIDDLLPGLCRQLPPSFELVRESTNTRLFVTQAHDRSGVLDLLRPLFAKTATSPAAVAIYATSGRLGELRGGAWIPDYSGPGLFAV